MTTTGAMYAPTTLDVLNDLRAHQTGDTAARHALLASAVADGWFAVRVTDDVTAYMEPTRGLVAGDSYRIIYAYAATGDIAVVERTL